ncbi:MAG: hypothetical protein AAGA48_21230 [Myxococcota bacterium]
MTVLVGWPLVVACICTPAPPPHETVRMTSTRLRIDDQAALIETPVIQLLGPEGPLTVMGTLHVAEATYYDALNRHLKPIVLFEGLASEPAPEEATADVPFVDALSAHGLAAQDLGLDRDERWVRADMSVTELEHALRAAGANDEVVQDFMGTSDRSALTRLFTATQGDARRSAVARLTLLESLAIPMDPAMDLYWEVVVGQRNAVALNTLAEQPGAQTLIYGVDHVADLTARLERQGFKVETTRWETALRVAYADLQLGRVQVEQRLTPLLQ